MRTRYLSADEILWVHYHLVDSFSEDFPEGSLYGLLDRHLLESATGRPSQTVGGEDAYPSLASKAAALTHSLILNHPFLNANKRTAVLSVTIFISLNGRRVVTPRLALYDVAIGVEDKSLDVGGLTTWFEDPQNVLPVIESEIEEVADELRELFDP